jgi:isopentenyldiphosphate isomerase
MVGLKENVKKIMAHLFRQMYVDEIDYMSTEIVYRQIQKLEEETRINQDEIDGNQWSRFEQRVEGLDEEVASNR